MAPGTALRDTPRHARTPSHRPTRHPRHDRRRTARAGCEDGRHASRAHLAQLPRMGLRRPRRGGPGTARRARPGGHPGGPHPDRRPVGPVAVAQPAGARGVVGHRPRGDARLRPADHALTRGRRGPRDRAHLAGRPAQRAPADVLRRARPARRRGRRRARDGLPARRAEPAGDAGADGRPGAAARRRLRGVHRLPPRRVPHPLPAGGGGTSGSGGLGAGDRGVDHLRAVRRTGARLRTGPARGARAGRARRWRGCSRWPTRSRTRSGGCRCTVRASEPPGRASPWEGVPPPPRPAAAPPT